MHRNQAMATVYKPARADGNRSHGYQCMGDYHDGGRFCGCTSGPQVDRAVVDAVMQRVSPPGLEAIRDAARAATAGESAELHRRKIELHRVREQETLLEQKFLNLDESSVEIAKSLESKLEAAKRQIARLERELVSELSPVARFDDAAFAELAQLSGDLRALWDEPTTTNQDRKQILRILIQNVVLEYRDAERIRLRIVWNDGTPDTETGSALGGRADKLIAEMEAAGLHPEEIAARLNELGIRTLSGRSFKPRVIAQRFRNRARRNKRKTVSHRRSASTR